MTEPHTPPTNLGTLGKTPDPGPLFGQASKPRTAPDPGTPNSYTIALVVVGLLYLVLSVTQNLTPYLVEKTDPVGREPRGGGVAKVMLVLDDAFDRAGFSTDNMLGKAAASQYAADELPPADKLQAVLVFGETESPEAALDWLAAIRSGQELGPLASRLSLGREWSDLIQRQSIGDEWAVIERKDGDELDTESVADAEMLQALYTEGAESLSPEQEARLLDRYGWLGQLALTPEGDSAERRAMFADLPWVIAIVVLGCAVVVIGGLGGLTMAVIAAVYFFNRRLTRRFDPPSPGGSVFLESFGVFLAGFGVVHFGGAVVAQLALAPQEEGSASWEAVARWVMLGTLLAQWTLVVTIFWPRLRGMDMLAWRHAVGWHAPHGVWREILAGVAGYFAGLPLLFCAFVLTIVLQLVSSWVLGGPSEPPANPMLDLVANGDALVIVLFLSLATVWAPIVEETLFRGAVYRHMRARHGALLCAIATALLFAFMHSYGPLLTAPLIALGFTFAMIREWRGSLIGAITAHCLHNATIMTLMLVGVRATM
jgi:membrane protease YdiL (CAAX protease family)